MNRKLLVILTFILVFLCSCGNNIPQEEHREIIEESDVNSEETMGQMHVYASRDYIIDENELKLALVEQDEKIEFQLFASASDYEYGSIIFTYFYGMFKELPVDSFNIMVNVGPASAVMIPVDNGYHIMGSNSDGTPTLSMPDWFVEECTMSEETINIFLEELNKVKDDFANTASDDCGEIFQ